MILNEPLSLSPRGLCLERMLDLDRLRSLDVAWPPAVAAGGLATSPSAVDGSGEGPFLAARRLFVGLPVIMRYSRKWAIFRLLIVTYNYHVGVTNFVVISLTFRPRYLVPKSFI